MAAPQFVPTVPTHHPRDYESTPRRFDPWLPGRPGTLDGEGQPPADAGGMGVPGPDPGYVFLLLPLFREELKLTEGERLDDVERGVAELALKRAALFGRAPIVHDVRIAYTVWGFLDPQAPKELVAERRRRFEGIRLTIHHYPERRALVDAVPAETLRRTPDDIAQAYRADWRSLLAL